jgi:hypothetical protein
LQVRAILKRKVIREKLGEFLEQGHGLLRLLGNEAAPIPKEDVNAWAKSVEEFLEKNLGRAYIFRFRSNKEFATMSFGYGDKEREGLYKGLYIRVANLEHFAAEIGIG